MPRGASHPCVPGCRERVPQGQRRCSKHERQRERARGSAHARGYSARWRAYRKDFLRRNPLCAKCEAEGVQRPATVVNHIRAHKGDQALLWDPANHEPLCKPHHDRITNEGDFGR